MHIPHYDFVTSSRLPETTFIASADVILFDGIMAFHQVYNPSVLPPSPSSLPPSLPPSLLSSLLYHFLIPPSS